MQKIESLGLEEARKIGEAVLEASRKTEPQKKPMSVAVVDVAGDLIYFARMDGAIPLSAPMAIAKAYTAIQWKRDTIDILNRLKQGKAELGMERDISWFLEAGKFTPIPGGVLIKTNDGALVCAFGTSGRSALEPMGDEELARIGAKAFSVS